MRIGEVRVFYDVVGRRVHILAVVEKPEARCLMEIIVRDAQIEDAPAVVRLIGELAAAANETSPITLACAIQYLASPTSHILLAEIGQRAVGLVSYSLRPDLYHAANSCLIEELVVQADMRGQGVASRMMAELLARLSKMNCAEVSVSTLPNNRQAIRFYRKHGLVDEAVFLERHLDKPTS